MRVFSVTASMLPNCILSALPPQEWDLLRPLMSRVRLMPGQVVVEQGQAAEHVFFIEEGITSLMAEGGNRSRSVQVAMIGREGMVGGLALLGSDTTPFASAVTTVPGPALRVPVGALQRCMEDCPELHRLSLQYVQTLARQIMQTAAYNARGSVVERCGRWLLMAYDRMEGDDVFITHEALSIILGVRRTGITAATTALQDEGLIRTSRGRLRVLNRPGLEALLQRRAVDRMEDSGEARQAGAKV